MARSASWNAASRLKESREAAESRSWRSPPMRMKSTCIAGSSAIVVGMFVTLHAQSTLPVRAGTVEHIKVHGQSLEGNLEGDSLDRDVTVYLPPSYGTERTRRYPV